MKTSRAIHRGVRSTLVLALLVLPGCIVGEIRDELKSANNQLVCVQEGLDQANKGMDRANRGLDEANKGLASANDLLSKTNERLDRVENGLTRLDRTNTLIDNVEQGLGRIDNTNTSLTGLEKQLAMLESIEKSLIRVDQHLAGLRKSMGALDNMIPFLDLGGDYVEPQGEMPIIPNQAEGEAQVAAAEGKGGESAAGAATSGGGVASPAGEIAPAASAAPAAAPRDSLMGSWISAYPDQSVAMVVHADGTYKRAVRSPAVPAGSVPAGKPMIERGTWKREGTTVVFTLAAPEDAGDAQAGGAQRPAPPTPGGSAPAKAVVRTIKMISVSPRALAFEEDGAMWMFSRP